MNTVYIDVVFVVNMCIDYMLLFMTSSFLHIKTSFFKLILSSVVGSLFAVAIAVFQPEDVLKLILTISVLPLVLFLCYGSRRPITFLKIFITYFSVSVLLGGFATLFDLYLGELNNRMFVMFLCLTVFIVVFSKSIVIIGKETNMKRVRAVVEYQDNLIEICLLCDSGNLLVEPYKQLPVIMLDGRFKKKFDVSSDCDYRIIKFKSASGVDFAGVIFPKNISVYHKRKTGIDAAIGFVKEGLFSGCEYDGIIPSCLIDNL